MSEQPLRSNGRKTVLRREERDATVPDRRQRGGPQCLCGASPRLNQKVEDTGGYQQP